MLDIYKLTSNNNLTQQDSVSFSVKYTFMFIKDLRSSLQYFSAAHSCLRFMFLTGQGSVFFWPSISWQPPNVHPLTTFSYLMNKTFWKVKLADSEEMMLYQNREHNSVSFFFISSKDDDFDILKILFYPKRRCLFLRVVQILKNECNDIEKCKTI